MHFHKLSGAHCKFLVDLKHCDAIKCFDSVSEFGAAAAGQIVASLLSPESYVGWSVKDASWGVRAMKAALQQAGIAGAADLGVQWNLVKAGVQDKIDLWQTGGGGVAGPSRCVISECSGSSLIGSHSPQAAFGRLFLWALATVTREGASRSLSA